MKFLQTFYTKVNKCAVSNSQLMYIKDGMLTMSNLEDHLVMKTELPDGIYGLYNGKLLKEDDYPIDDNVVTTPTGKKTKGFTLPYLYQLKMVDMYPCLSDDGLRPVMTGINVHETDGRATFAGSDAHTLKVVRTDIKVKKDFNVIITKSVAFTNISKKQKSECKVSLLGDKHIVYEWENITLYQRLIEGKFPNYQSVIPLVDEELMTFLKSDHIDLNNLITDAKAIYSYYQKIDVYSDSLTICNLDKNITQQYKAFESTTMPTRKPDGLIMPVMLSDPRTSGGDHLFSFKGNIFKKLLNKHKGSVVFGSTEPSIGILVWLEDQAK